MRKFLSLFLVLFTLTFTFTLTCSAETLSDEILAQGKAEADLFLTLKQALGLDWIDEYNAYLGDPVTNPAPAWDTSVASLVSQGYLSSSFPTDFTIALTGQEVTISRTVSQAALREAMAIYLPAMTVSGDVVSLLVQRPAQWVAYETALNGKVDKDGSDNPDILPNSSLDFGSNSQINFVSDDGKIVGVSSLEYKGQELEQYADGRFVNIDGDTMTGVLTATGFKVGANNVWHQGNDGSGSGLDADLLDGQHGAFYQDASNLTAGTVPTGRLTGTYNIGISGNAATASKLATARTISLAGNATGSASFDGSGNATINTTVSYAATANHANDADYADDADKLDGLSSERFLASRGNKLPPSKGRVWTVGEFLSLAPGTYMVDQNISATEFGLPVDDKLFNLIIFPPNGAERGTAMILFRNGPVYVFNKHSGYASDPMSPSYWKQVWHSGSDGSGSGLDADLLDGQHGAFYQNASNLNTGVVPAARLSGTYEINITGNASTATNANHANNADYATNAGNADTLDGKHESAFAPASHNHGQYVLKAGDTMTGALTAPEYRINDANTKLLEGASNSVRIQTNSGYVDVGPQNTSWMHFSTDRPAFHFNKPVEAADQLKVYNTGTYLTGTEGRINNNIIWHKGNQGSGSGLDADMVDGKHASDLKSSVFVRKHEYNTPGTYTWIKGPYTGYVVVYLWGGGGGPSCIRPGHEIYGDIGGNSSFGNYAIAYGGGRATVGTNAPGGGFGGVTGVTGNIGGPGNVYHVSGTQSQTYGGKEFARGGNWGLYNANWDRYFCGGGGGGFATIGMDVTGIDSVMVTVGFGGSVTGAWAYPTPGWPGAVIIEEFTSEPNF